MSDSARFSQPQDDNQPQDDSQRLHDHLERLSEEQFQRQMREAALLLERGKGKSALPLLERCYALRPDDIDVLTNLGGAHILAGQHRHAIPYLERATELSPQNPAVWSNLAAAYLGKLVTATQERQQRAMAAYYRVIELDPAYPSVHYNLGLIHIDRREWDEAAEAFTQAIATNPFDNDARLMLRRVEEIRSQPPNLINN
ncbi:MAG: tetratricopeptide repeat protein [Chloroflexi bacterium]|nr:tetratricopeptide repeat protein [Chloroflexota bacterium]